MTIILIQNKMSKVCVEQKSIHSFMNNDCVDTVSYFMPLIECYEQKREEDQERYEASLM